MKIGCSTWSFHRDMVEKRLTFEGFLEACAELKMDGVELLGFTFRQRFLIPKGNLWILSSMEQFTIGLTL